MKFRALKMQIIKYIESIIFLFVLIIIIYKFIRNFEILFDYNFYYNEFTLIGKIIMPIFMIFIMYIMIFAIEYSIVIIIKFTNSYIKITNDYIE